MFHKAIKNNSNASEGIREGNLALVYNGGINPSTNFLLKKAIRLAENKTEAFKQVLYKLHNGFLAIHTQYHSQVVSDKLERVEKSKAEEIFKVNFK